MRQSLFTSLALFGTSALAQIGSAVVVNSCPYDVHVFNTPSADGGYEEQDAVIPTGGTWSQVWTRLTNGNGWAIKLSMSEDRSDILQYEYTWHDDGSLWFDLSAVNGDPWAGDWYLYSDGITCTPRQAAYQYPTDDPHGMQVCLGTSVITLNLCSKSPAGSATASWPSSTIVPSSTAAPVSSYSQSSVSTPAVTSASTTIPAPPTTPTSPTTLTTSTSANFHYPSWSHSHGNVQNAVAEASTSVATTPTTLATSTTVPVEEAPGLTVWEVETAVVTAVVTAVYTEPPSRIRRHEHHAGHQHAI